MFKNVSIEMIVAGIAAVAILMWPQFSAMVKNTLAASRAKRDNRPTVATPEKTRADWVTELMELHDLLIAAGETDLARLCSELCNGLICVVPPAGTPATPDE